MPVAAAKLCPICGLRYDGAAVFCQKDGARLSSEGLPDPFLGTVLLGQFRIDEAIGAGGMGTVYRAHQTNLHRDVAVKILHPELTKNADAVRRFHREAKVATSLEHPNLVRVFLFGELPDDGGLYLVMEYLDGKSVTDVMREGGALPIPRALHLVAQICGAIGAAHAKGIVHRDVKPENLIVVNRHGDPDFVKVLDFGIARLLWDDQSALTQSGVIFGTARYISPEGASGDATDARSDVYSIGVLLYQMLSGVTPFEASSPVPMLMKHIHEAAPPLRSMGIGDRVPQAIADVVMRTLAKNPDARHDTASDLGMALAEAAAKSGIALPQFRAGGGISHPSIVAYPSPTSTAREQTAPVRIPGLKPTKSTLLLAFILGAAGLVLGFMGVQRWLADPVDPMAERVAQARVALDAGHFDTPPGDNVAELTAAILGDAPDHPGAVAVRAEAASRLRALAVSARAAEDFERARDLYARMLVFAPHDPTATAALEALEHEEEPGHDEEPGMNFAPESPVRVGETVSFLAVLHEHEHAGHGEGEAQFEIRNQTRRLRTIDAIEVSDGHFVGNYTFRSQGSYIVRFVADDAQFEAPIVVQRGRVVRQTPMTTPTMEEVPTPPSMMGTPTPPVFPAMDDGIDWTVPPAGGSMDEAPPPWTGNGSVI